MVLDSQKSILSLSERLPLYSHAFCFQAEAVVELFPTILDVIPREVNQVWGIKSTESSQREIVQGLSAIPGWKVEPLTSSNVNPETYDISSFDELVEVWPSIISKRRLPAVTSLSFPLGIVISGGNGRGRRFVSRRIERLAGKSGISKIWTFTNPRLPAVTQELYILDAITGEDASFDVLIQLTIESVHDQDEGREANSNGDDDVREYVVITEGNSRSILIDSRNHFEFFVDGRSASIRQVCMDGPFDEWWIEVKSGAVEMRIHPRTMVAARIKC